MNPTQSSHNSNLLNPTHTNAITSASNSPRPHGDLNPLISSAPIISQHHTLQQAPIISPTHSTQGLFAPPMHNSLSNSGLSAPHHDGLVKHPNSGHTNHHNNYITNNPHINNQSFPPTGLQPLNLHNNNINQFQPNHSFGLNNNLYHHNTPPNTNSPLNNTPQLLQHNYMQSSALTNHNSFGSAGTSPAQMSAQLSSYSNTYHQTNQSNIGNGTTGGNNNHNNTKHFSTNPIHPNTGNSSSRRNNTTNHNNVQNRFNNNNNNNTNQTIANNNNNQSYFHNNPQNATNYHPNGYTNAAFNGSSSNRGGKKHHHGSDIPSTSSITPTIQTPTSQNQFHSTIIIDQSTPPQDTLNIHSLVPMPRTYEGIRNTQDGKGPTKIDKPRKSVQFDRMVSSTGSDTMILLPDQQQQLQSGNSDLAASTRRGSNGTDLYSVVSNVKPPSVYSSHVNTSSRACNSSSGSTITVNVQGGTKPRRDTRSTATNSTHKDHTNLANTSNILVSDDLQQNQQQTNNLGQSTESNPIAFDNLHAVTPTITLTTTMSHHQHPHQPQHYPQGTNIPENPFFKTKPCIYYFFGHCKKQTRLCPFSHSLQSLFQPRHHNFIYNPLFHLIARQRVPLPTTSKELFLFLVACLQHNVAFYDERTDLIDIYRLLDEIRPNIQLNGTFFGQNHKTIAEITALHSLLRHSNQHIVSKLPQSIFCTDRIDNNDDLAAFVLDDDISTTFYHNNNDYNVNGIPASNVVTAELVGTLESYGRDALLPTISLSGGTQYTLLGGHWFKTRIVDKATYQCVFTANATLNALPWPNVSPDTTSPTTTAADTTQLTDLAPLIIDTDSPIIKASSKGKPTVKRVQNSIAGNPTTPVTATTTLTENTIEQALDDDIFTFPSVNYIPSREIISFEIFELTINSTYPESDLRRFEMKQASNHSIEQINRLWNERFRLKQYPASDILSTLCPAPPDVNCWRHHINTHNTNRLNQLAAQANSVLKPNNRNHNGNNNPPSHPGHHHSNNNNNMSTTAGRSFPRLSTSSSQHSTRHSSNTSNNNNTNRQSRNTHNMNHYNNSIANNVAANPNTFNNHHQTDGNSMYNNNPNNNNNNTNHFHYPQIDPSQTFMNINSGHHFIDPTRMNHDPMPNHGYTQQQQQIQTSYIPHPIESHHYFNQQQPSQQHHHHNNHYQQQQQQQQDQSHFPQAPYQQNMNYDITNLSLISGMAAMNINGIPINPPYDITMNNTGHHSFQFDNTTNISHPPSPMIHQTQADTMRLNPPQQQQCHQPPHQQTTYQF